MQNIVILAGNIGQKPEVRSTQSGTKITNFTLATSRPRLSEGRVMRDENGYRVMDTEWHRITCFNGLGKTVAEHCEKGMKVLVHGRIHYTKWTDATGTDRYGCEIIAEKVDFLSRPKSAENENPELVDRDDEIPFYERGLSPWVRGGNPPGSLTGQGPRRWFPRSLHEPLPGLCPEGRCRRGHPVRPQGWRRPRSGKSASR